MRKTWQSLYRAMRSGKSCQTAGGDYRHYEPRDFYWRVPGELTPEAWRDVCDYAGDLATPAPGDYRASYTRIPGGRVIIRTLHAYWVSPWMGGPEHMVSIPTARRILAEAINRGVSIPEVH